MLVSVSVFIVYVCVCGWFVCLCIRVFNETNNYLSICFFNAEKIIPSQLEVNIIIVLKVLKRAISLTVVSGAAIVR